MKRIIYMLAAATLLVVAFAFTVTAAPSGNPAPAAKLAQDIAFGERALININNMSLWFKRDGWSARNPLYSSLSGVTFPRGTDQVIYQDGLIWGGRVYDGDPQIIRVGGQTYEVGTVPGAIGPQPSLGLARGEAEDEDDPSVRIYRVRRDYQTGDLTRDIAELLDISETEVTEADIAALRDQYEKNWNEWPVEKGAPFFDRDGNGLYDPTVDEPAFRDANCVTDPEACGSNADQIAWFVINDLDDGATATLYGAKPIGIETQITMWAYAQTGPLGDVIFKKFRVMYKGRATSADTSRVEDMYFAQWSDPDLGDAGDDFAGSDIDLSLGYAYNGADEDSHYRGLGMAPPAAGYDFLQGPIVRAYQVDDLGAIVTDASGNPVVDETVMANFNFEKLAGWQNLPMTAFVYFAAGSAISDPELGEYQGSLQWFNLLRGFQPNAEVDNPTPYTDPTTGQPTKFTLYGDPNLGTGWNDGVPLPFGDRRIVLATGPFTMALGDTQEVVVGLLGGASVSRLASVSKLKFTDKFVQETFDSNFDVPQPPASPTVRVDVESRAATLDWGWDPAAIDATEDGVKAPYRFEGYNVYQFPTADGNLSQAVRVATYDLANGVTTVMSLQLDDVSGAQVMLPTQLGSDSGLRWYITLTDDKVDGGKLINGKKYYYGVSAYAVNPDPDAVDNNKESVPVVVEVIPQSTLPGFRQTHALGSALEIEQVQGTGVATVTATVVAPSLVQGATYKVTFNTDESWNLLKNGATVLASQTNLSLDDSAYAVVEGIQVKVGVGSFAGTAPATYSAAEVIVDADPSDGDLALWGDGQLFGYPNGWSIVFNGGGTEDWTRLINDIELRFTGVDSDGDGAIDSGGQMGTLAGVSGGSGLRDIDAHPYRPADAPATGSFLQRAPFEVWDVEDPDNPRQINVAWFDRGADGSRDDGSVEYHKSHNMPGRDYISVFDTDYDPTKIHELDDADGTWSFFFRQGGASVWSTGDVFRITYPNPIVPGDDEYQFVTAAEAFSEEAAQEDVELINVFPNPYFGINEAETTPYEKLVTFSHLPSRATIRIFDLAGVLVRTLEADGTQQFLEWDLENHNGLPVASGLYIAHISLPDVGKEKVLKLAIVTEQQFLENY